VGGGGGGRGFCVGTVDVAGLGTDFGAGGIRDGLTGGTCGRWSGSGEGYSCWEQQLGHHGW